MKPVIVLVQAGLALLIAPLISGLIRKLKNNLRMRSGAPVLQPYFNLSKLFSKQEVVSENASWIFRATPAVVLASSLCALLLVPSLIPGITFDRMGDFISILFILALGRFFLALAGLDAGSAFGGMGSSREMFISSLVEPVALVAVFAVSLSRGSTSLGVISSFPGVPVSALIAGAALFAVTLAETSRLPVDNQETHLELTMTHEAMALEYSGPSLAFIEIASHVKQVIFFSLIAAIILPQGAPCGNGAASLLCYAALYGAKLLAIAGAVGFLEVAIAKMRLFRVPDFLAFAFVLSGIALVAAAMGL
ncbi:MAG: respiratory chain complex I subunit 1 family protein [Endomicrobiales bacterium]